MVSQKDETALEQSNDFIKLQDIFYLSLSKWRLFVFSIVCCLGFGAYYLLKTPPTYSRVASIIFKNEFTGESSLSSAIGTSFSYLGLANQSTNGYSEMVQLESPSLMVDVVKILGLNVSYSLEGRFYNKSLYGKTLPIRVEFADKLDTNLAFHVNLTNDGNLKLSEFSVGEDRYEVEVDAKFGEMVKTPVGVMVFSKTKYYDSLMKDYDYSKAMIVSRCSYYDAGIAFTGPLKVEQNDEKSAVINVSYSDTSAERAEDILNTLMVVYNKKWEADKNIEAKNSSEFIDERLAVIEQELGVVDQSISSFKSSTRMPDIAAASGLYMNQTAKNDAKLVELNTQMSIAQYIYDYICDGKNKSQLIPSNAGIADMSIERQISEYNKLLLERLTIVSNSSESNPIAVEMDSRLAIMREAIAKAFANYKVTIKTQISDLEKEGRRTSQKLADGPEQAKYLLSVERQQKVKEALYLYLLQKKEENQLSQAFETAKIRIVTPPIGKKLPTYPVTKNIILISFAMGLLIPLVYIFVEENLNTKVRGIKDLEGLKVPFLGEIPLVGKPVCCIKKLLRKLKKKPEHDNYGIVVKSNTRNIINEAFRVIRSNIEFMVNSEDGANVIMLTSSCPDSGKTFISSNLSVAFAIKNKKVCLIDLDMRKGCLSSLFGNYKVGMSSYLAGKETIDNIIVKNAEGISGLDLIPVGILPPNPAELLYDEKFANLIKFLKERYDYIFIDCPPIEVVADAKIVNSYVDSTFFVVRAGLFERASLPRLDKFYNDKTYKNLGVILNGTDHTTLASRKYGYGYGYGYGNDNLKEN